MRQLDDGRLRSSLAHPDLLRELLAVPRLRGRGLLPQAAAVQRRPAVASSPDRKLRLVLRGIDEDPLDNTTRPPRTGGPSSATVLRTTVTVIGKNADGRDTTYKAPSSFTPQFVIDLAVDAPYIVGTDLTLRVELCDCPECEVSPGSGRCIDYRTDSRYSIPVTVPPPTAARTTSSANVSSTVPGSPQAVGRSSP
jgi:hypothetical protein